MFWFDIEANRDTSFANGFFSIAMSWKSLLKLELWSHRDVFGSIARGHDFFNAFGHKGLNGHNVVTDALLWVDDKMQGE